MARIDGQLARIEAAEARGWVVLVTWNGGRTAHTRRVVLLWGGEVSVPSDRPTFSADGDDVVALLTKGLDWAENHTSGKSVLVASPAGKAAEARRPMIDENIGRIESAEAAGWVLLVKWDGARAINRRTVVLSMADEAAGAADPPTFRMDGDDVAALLSQGLDWIDDAAHRRHS